MEKIGRKKAYFPNPDLPIGLWCLDVQAPRDAHSHAFTEIAIIQAGRGVHSFEKTLVPARAGDVFVIHAGCAHAWAETEDLTVANLMITELEAIPELVELRVHPAFDALFVHEPNLRHQQKGGGFLHLEPGELTEVAQMTRRLDRALHQTEKPYPLIARTLLVNLVSLFCEAYLVSPRKRQQAVLRVGRAVRHLETNWRSPPDHEELAAIMHVSVATFYRLFRRATGCTPANYLNRVRVAEACKLLAGSDESITEVAQAVGFADSNYFSRIFRQVHGMSPRAYRRDSSARA